MWHTTKLCAWNDFGNGLDILWFDFVFDIHRSIVLVLIYYNISINVDLLICGKICFIKHNVFMT